MESGVISVLEWTICRQKHIHTFGTSGLSKTVEFSEKFQTASDPRPPYLNFMLKKPVLKLQNLQHKFFYWKRPPPH